MPQTYLPPDIQNRAQSEKKISLGSIAKNMATGFVTYAAASAIGGTVSRLLVKGLATKIPSLATMVTKNAAAIAAADTSFSAPIASALKIHTDSFITPTIGSLIGLQFKNRAIAGGFGVAIKDFLQNESAIADVGKAKTMQQWASSMSSYAKPINATSSAFNRFVAGTAVRAVRTMGEIPGFYLLDRSLGGLYGVDNRDRAPITDIPGTLKDITKYAREVGPGFMLFKTASPAFNVGRYGLMSAIKQSPIKYTFEHLYSVGSHYGMQAKAALNLGSRVYKQINDNMYEGFMNRRTHMSLSEFTKPNQVYDGMRKAFGVVGRNLAHLNKQNFRDELNTVNINNTPEGIRNRLRLYGDAFRQRESEVQTQASTQKNAGAYSFNLKKSKRSTRKFIKLGFEELETGEKDKTSAFGYILSSGTDDNLKYKSINFNNKQVVEWAKKLGVIDSKDSSKFSKFVNKFGTDFTVYNTLDIGKGLYSDIGKVSRSGFGHKLSALMENVSVKIPMKSIGMVIGKRMDDIEFPIFKMLGLTSMANRTKGYVSVMNSHGTGGGKIQMYDETLSNVDNPIHILSERQSGGYINGRPFVVDYLNGSFEFGAHEQRWRSVDKSIYEKAYSRLLRSKTAEERKRYIHEYNQNTINAETFLQLARERNINITGKSAYDIEKEVLGTSSWTTLIGTGRLVMDSIKYKMELGEYGYASASMPKDLLSRVSKFFAPNSSWNMYGEKGEWGFIKKNIDSFSTLNKEEKLETVTRALKFQDRVAYEVQSNRRKLLYATKWQDLERILKSKALSGNKYKDMVISGDASEMYTHLSDMIPKIEQSITKTDRDMLENAMNIAQNMMTEKNVGRNLSKKIYGMEMPEMEYLRKSMLLAQDIETTVGEGGQRSLATEVYDNLLKGKQTKIEYLKDNLSMIGSENPFALHANISRLQRNSAELKRATIIPNDKVDLNAAFNRLDEFVEGKKGLEDFVNVFEKHIPNLQQFSHSGMRIFSPRTDEWKYAQSLANDSVVKAFGGRMMMLDKINVEHLGQHTSTIQNHMFSNVFRYYMAERTNRVAAGIGLAVDPNIHTNASSMISTFMMKKTLPLMGLIAGWEVLDQLTDIANLGAFDEGLNVFAGEKVIQMQDLSSKIRDKIGITNAAKYLEGLAPGLVDSPGMKAARVLGWGVSSALAGTILGNPAIGAAFGIAGAAMQDFGLNDLAKTNEENQDIWTGRKSVPIRGGARWTFSKAFYGGDRIEGWAPHWFARLKSQAEYTDVLYGSKAEALIYKPWSLLGFNPIGNIIDPYHYERCVTEDTEILTDNFITKTAKEININNSVITSNGTNSIVEDKWIENIEEDIIEIDVAYSPFNVKTTKEHRYLAVKTGKCICGRNRKTWVRADQLCVDDYLAFPKLKLEEYNDSFLFIDKYETYTIKKSEDLYKFIGLYLAKGHTDNQSIYLILHRDELELAKNMQEIIKKQFNLSSYIYHYENKILFRIYSAWFIRFINSIITKGALNKVVTKEVLMANKNNLSQLLAYFFIGTHKGHAIEVSATTISKKLASQLYSILHILDFVPSFEIIHRKNYDLYMLRLEADDGNRMRKLCNWPIIKEATAVEDYYIKDNYIYYKIRNINIINYKGKIVDLKIKNNYSFSTFNAVLHNTHYRDRPYLYTGSAFEEIPFVGSILGSTVGQLVKPSKTMHLRDLALSHGAYVSDSFNNKNAKIQKYAEASLSYQGGDISPSVMDEQGVNIASPYSVQGTMDTFIKNGLYQPLGLYGWAGKISSNMLFGKDTPVSPDLMIESSNRMTDFSRFYWDQDFGDAITLNEFIRRGVPNKPMGYNPLRNNMADWMPGGEYKVNYKQGDPFAKSKLGEYRLPGKGYEALHNVELTFPSGAELAGYDPRNMALTMAGVIPNDELAMQESQEAIKIKGLVKESMMARGMIRKTEQFVYDPVSDMSGEADMVGRYGQVIQIKTVKNTNQLLEMKAPSVTHAAEVNIVMNAMDANFGSIIYVSEEDPTQAREFNVNFNRKQYWQTVRNVTEARKIATTLDRELLAPGAGYSHLDRFKILADIAPLSRSYYKEKTVLDEQARLGILSTDEYYKYYESIKMSEAQMRPTDVYPNRFIGHVLNPKEVYGIDNLNMAAKNKSDAIRRGQNITEDYKIVQKGLDAEYNMFNLNSNIKDASQYSIPERVIGAAWEAGMKVPVPYLSRKLFQHWTPMEAYRYNILQGSKNSYWNTPYESFVQPIVDQTFASADPMSGAIAGATLGSFLGPAGTLFGGMAGGVSGLGRGIYEAAGGAPYIKQDIAKGREIERYFNDVMAVSAKAEYERSGNIEALKEYNKTLIGSTGYNDYFGSFAGLPKAEKGYISLIAASGDTEQMTDLMRYLPKDNAEALRKYRDQAYEVYKAPQSTYDGPALEWSLVNNDEAMNKMKYRVLQESGVDAHLSGLGWKNQIYTNEAKNGIIDVRNPQFARDNKYEFSDAAIKNVIYAALRESGCTGMVNIAFDGNNEFNVEIV